jgi:hypothetical protein
MDDHNSIMTKRLIEAVEEADYFRKNWWRYGWRSS